MYSRTNLRFPSHLRGWTMSCSLRMYPVALMKLARQWQTRYYLTCGARLSVAIWRRRSVDKPMKATAEPWHQSIYPCFFCFYTAGADCCQCRKTGFDRGCVKTKKGQQIPQENRFCLNDRVLFITEASLSATDRAEPSRFYTASTRCGQSTAFD